MKSKLTFLVIAFSICFVCVPHAKAQLDYRGPCSSVSVNCNDYTEEQLENDGNGGTMSTIDCVMNLKPETCEDAGLDHLGEYSVLELLGILWLDPNCTLLHEAVHAAQDWSTMSRCEAEAQAHSTENPCLNDLVSESCGASISNETVSDDCQNTITTMCQGESMGSFYACLEEEDCPDEEDLDDCHSCKKEARETFLQCLESYPSMAEVAENTESEFPDCESCAWECQGYSGYRCNESASTGSAECSSGNEGSYSCSYSNDSGSTQVSDNYGDYYYTGDDQDVQYDCTCSCEGAATPAPTATSTPSPSYTSTPSPTYTSTPAPAPASNLTPSSCAWECQGYSGYLCNESASTGSAECSPANEDSYSCSYSNDSGSAQVSDNYGDYVSTGNDDDVQYDCYCRCGDTSTSYPEPTPSGSSSPSPSASPGYW